jgi:hypothetical protein
MTPNNLFEGSISPRFRKLPEKLLVRGFDH